jgi:hypothetical protein
METRNFAWAVLGLLGIASAMLGLGILFPVEKFLSDRFSDLLSIVAIGLGLRFLYQTGVYQHSPLWRFQRIGIALLIFSSMLRIMHFPGAQLVLGLAFLTIVANYSVHFFLKPRKGTGDILRLLVVLVTATMGYLNYLHFIRRDIAAWASMGLMGLTILEFLLNEPDLPPPTKPGKAQQAQVQSDLQTTNPELFE